MRALIDLEGDHGTFLLGVVLRRGGHAYIGIAVRMIETAHQVLVVLDAVGIVDVVVENKAQNIGDAGFHHGFELDLRKSRIAGKYNVFHRELFAFLDLENEIDPVVFAARLWLYRLRHYLRVEIAVRPIDIENMDDVALH